MARTAGAGLGEYLARALSHRAALAEPKALAWLLASYARDGLARVEAAGDAPQLTAVRSALEEALGVLFEGEKGARFFRSTLVQTLFYGVFSAWVLWARTETVRAAAHGPLLASQPDPTRFRWREAVWHLRSPVLAALFSQLAQPDRLQPLGLVEAEQHSPAHHPSPEPDRLQPLGLVEVLDWAAAALAPIWRQCCAASPPTWRAKVWGRWRGRG